jgi:chromosome segregation ATPase
MSGWLGIIALIITTVGGSFGVTFLNNRKELVAMKLKMQKENEDKIEGKLRQYIDYIEGKLKQENERSERLYKQYIDLQTEAIKREAELQMEKQKTLSAIQELQIVKHEYQVLKDQFFKEKRHLEEQNRELKASIETLNLQQKTLLDRIRMLEKGQLSLSDEIHHGTPSS